MYALAWFNSPPLVDEQIKSARTLAQGISAGEWNERMELHNILTYGQIAPVFQPIVSLRDHSIYGYESLSRLSHQGTINNPELLFEKARQFGLTVQIERLCRQKALHRLAELGLEGMIFLNVCPALLCAESHRRGFTAELLDELGLDRSRVVFELTEKSLINDYELFERGVAHYRSQGYKIAIDDLGDGYAGLKMLSQITPDYVKLARFLVSDIDKASARQALVEAITCFCKKIGARVIAEGIERPEELAYLSAIQVDYAQGYLLAKPSAEPPRVGEFGMPEFMPHVYADKSPQLCRIFLGRAFNERMGRGKPGHIQVQN